MTSACKTAHAGRHRHATWIGAAAVLATVALCASARAEGPYHYYFGNTHAHSQNSDGKELASEHFRLAKAAGYDFYAITDHALAKYPDFTPRSYEETKRAADQATDKTFVAIAGFEFSENDGPGGKGHLNVLNTASYLDATGPKVNLPIFYDWLVKNHTPTVAASFNHSGDGSYNGFDYLTPERRDEITMFEVINSGKLHYGSYLVALNKGWRVAPIAGNDSHGTWRIGPHKYRTGVLAPSLMRDNLMQAMRARRVYCTWDKNLKLSFTANGRIMGSVLQDPSSLAFSITASDPDTGDPDDRITKIEIVGDNGELVGSKEFSAHSVTWNATYAPRYKYCFVKVYTADKADGPAAYAEKKAGKAAADLPAAGPPARPPDIGDSPTAYSAPVWIEKSKN